MVHQERRTASVNCWKTNTSFLLRNISPVRSTQLTPSPKKEDAGLYALPPYYCEYNRIELIRAHVKKRIVGKQLQDDGSEASRQAIFWASHPHTTGWMLCSTLTIIQVKAADFIWLLITISNRLSSTHKMALHQTRGVTMSQSSSWRSRRESYLPGRKLNISIYKSTQNLSYIFFFAFT